MNEWHWIRIWGTDKNRNKIPLWKFSKNLPQRTLVWGEINDDLLQSVHRVLGFSQLNFVSWRAVANSVSTVQRKKGIRSRPNDRRHWIYWGHILKKCMFLKGCQVTNTRDQYQNCPYFLRCLERTRSLLSSLWTDMETSVIFLQYRHRARGEAASGYSNQSFFENENTLLARRPLLWAAELELPPWIHFAHHTI